jgi:hypothetical protein
LSCFPLAPPLQFIFMFNHGKTKWDIIGNILRTWCEHSENLFPKNLPPKDPKERNQVPPEPCHWLQDSEYHFQPGWIPPSEHYKLGVFIMLDPCAIGRCFLLDAWMKTWKRFSHFHKCTMRWHPKRVWILGPNVQNFTSELF